MLQYNFVWLYMWFTNASCTGLPWPEPWKKYQGYLNVSVFVYQACWLMYMTILTAVTNFISTWVIHQRFACSVSFACQYSFVYLLQLLYLFHFIESIGIVELSFENTHTYSIKSSFIDCHDNWAATRDFQQCGILTSVDSDEPLQPPMKFRNSKWCSVSSITVIE